MPRKLFILAGELSGDMHAEGAVAQLLRREPGMKVFGVGGPRLRALGAELLYDTDSTAVMGFIDVLRHSRFLKRVIADLQEAIERERPDAALLVDYPGMNLIMARFLHERGIPVVYYISPQVWAWKERRVEKIRRWVDRMLVIFDFEVEFFRRHRIEAEFVGHPVVEELASLTLPSREDFLRSHDLAPEVPLVGLLPGSRRQELAHIFPSMLDAARLIARERRVTFLLARASGLDASHFALLERFGELKVVECSAYEVMRHADVGLVTSGTATLESLCFGMPMVVLYRTGWLNYQIGRRVVKLKSISLANIVAAGLGSAHQAVPELIQHEANPERIAREALRILEEPAVADTMRRELLAARSKLASSSPSAKVADAVLESMSANRKS